MNMLVRVLVLGCLCFLPARHGALALDGILGPSSTGTARIGLYVSPRLEAVNKTLDLTAASPQVSGDALRIALVTNVEPVDYIINPSISGSNSSLGTFDLRHDGVVINAVMDKIRKEYNGTGEPVTVVLVAQQKPQ